MTTLCVRLRHSARSVHVLGLVVASAVALGAMAVHALGADPGRSTTRAFLMSKSDIGIHYGKFEDDCPAGFELTVEEEYLATLSPAERERMLRPENAKEYAKAWKDDFITGPGGENVCNNPKSFLNDPRRRVYVGVCSKDLYGLYLGGTSYGNSTL